MGTAGRSDYRYHRATKIIVMESCRAHTIIAGTSFAMLITALRDDVELPEELPDTIPSAWLDNLDRYRIVLLLSTSKHGPKAIAGTAAEYELKIERRDSARYFVNIPASATEEMEEGEIVLTVELQDTQTGNESRTAHGSTCQSKTMKLLCILQQGDLSVTDGSVLSHRLYFDFANRIGIDGKDGEDGTDGTDGLTPEIGKDGNWWIGDRNTGVPAVAFRSYASLAAFPKQGNNDMLYLDETTNRFYRWDAPAQNYRTVSPDYNDIKIIDGGNAQF